MFYPCSMNSIFNDIILREEFEINGESESAKNDKIREHCIKAIDVKLKLQVEAVSSFRLSFVGATSLILASFSRLVRTR